MDTNRAFAVLELSPDVSLNEAKEAYRLLAKVWHPDMHVHNPKLHLKATEKTKEINAAWGIVQEFYNGKVYNNINEQNRSNEDQHSDKSEYERGVKDEAKRRASEIRNRNNKIVETAGIGFFVLLLIGAALFIFSVVVPFLGVPVSLTLGWLILRRIK